MTKAKLRAATLGGRADDIEHAFYEALRHANLDQLMACWADEEDIVCVHPGGPRLVGTGAIRAAFADLFAKGNIQAYPERIHKIESLASAVHHLVERIELMTPQGPHTAWVIATNVFHKTAQGWRLVAHHASPGTPTDAQEAGQPGMVLH